LIFNFDSNWSNRNRISPDELQLLRCNSLKSDEHPPNSGSKNKPNEKTAWSEQEELFDPEDGGDISLGNVG
jgi:hypothetical protein